MANNTVKTYVLNVDVQSGKIQINGLTDSFVKADNAFNKLSTDIATNATKASDGLNKMVNKSGLASAAVVEMGRTVTDFNYGIPAMANNITQLSSLMTTLIGDVGGISNAIGALKKAIWGPLGILLLFQALITVWEAFSKEAKKSKETIEDANKSLASQIELLELLKEGMLEATISIDSVVKIDKQLGEILKSTNGGLEERNRVISDYILLKKEELIIEALKKEVSDKLVGIDADNLKNQKDLIENKIKSLELESEGIVSSQRREAISNILVSLGSDLSKVTKQINEYDDNRIRITNELNEALERQSLIESKLNIEKQKLIAGTLGDLNNQKKILEETRDNFSKSRQTYDAYSKAIAIIQAKIDAITGGKKTKEKKQSKEKELKDFESHTLDLLSIADKYNQKDRELTAQNEIEKLIIQREYAVKELTDKIKKFADDERARLNEFLSSDASDKQKEEAKKQYNENVKQITIDGREALLAINKYYDDKGVKAVEDANKKIEDKILAMLKSDKERAEKVAELKLEAWVKRLDKIKQVLGQLNGLTDMYFQNEITKEQNHTNEVNNELRNRLNEQGLSADERKNIQNQIEQNDEKSRIAQEKIKKKQFQVDKAFRIAGAVVDTASAVVQAMRNNGGIPKAIPAMIATAALGAAQIALIAKQQFQTSASTMGANKFQSSGGEGGGNSKQFDFNLVGSSNTNQLSKAIAGKFSEPIKAYVVSREVTSKQELDNKIKHSATISG